MVQRPRLVCIYNVHLQSLARRGNDLQRGKLNQGHLAYGKARIAGMTIINHVPVRYEQLPGAIMIISFLRYKPSSQALCLEYKQ